MRARIVGTGSYVPAKVLTNADLERMVATSDEWIVERTGIRERHVAGSGEACSDLAVKAAERALTAAGVSAADLDLILLATCTGDYPIPATACLIQHQLGATRAAACDLSAACCGFVYALSVADAYVKTGMRHVLIIGSEVMSAITDWTDRNTCLVFGDGAGAAVISASENDRGILSTHLRSDGALCDLIAVPGGGSRLPPSEKVVAERMQYIKMKGNETFKVAVRTLEEVAREMVRQQQAAPKTTAAPAPKPAPPVTVVTPKPVTAPTAPPPARRPPRIPRSPRPSETRPRSPKRRPSLRHP